ncbi:glycoside hydrolase family 2 protein [Cerasicoccus arenae]|uniref:Beta-glucuronidase n=1 Tax=Cerasicoccus arenae TaxID=424488 RepID=A0A8J3DL34_9BACT|nr:glycoside hydrolase family 2 TIM barrel-domain containing protein [Cerasicoccus arenae]MBK1859729.1 hypothetical protein [Cerasicoccus arenae]GHC06026.1 beta-glucuronidase [Cerasicoccus arenae]
MNTTHTLRSTTSLSGLWDFTFCRESLNSITLADIAFNDRIPVPMAFDALPMYPKHRGIGCYRTTISVPAGSPAYLMFEAVSMTGRIYIDGQLCAENKCGYEPFKVTVPMSDNASRELIVLADNRFDFGARPMHEEYFDFYQYGGITRGVTLHILPVERSSIRGLYITPLPGYREGEVRVDLDLDNAAAKQRFNFSIDGETIPVEVGQPDATGKIHFTTKVADPTIWSPATPNLHIARAELLDENEAAYDDAQVRFGLRRIEARGQNLFLNGEPLELRGYNRHEFHPNFGPTTPELQMFQDIHLMKGMGCNFVRGSHYHQDQRFLDLCDELGLLVWEENLGWGQREKTFKHPDFAAQHDKALRSMVDMSFNHPSIIMWGFLNECGSNEDYARPVFEESVQTLRALDSSRLITFATMFVEGDKMLDLVDIISINIYPGWYGALDVEDPVSQVAPRIEAVIESVNSRGFADKPLMVSEIGAEALYGWRDAHEDFFTEQYQARLLAEACRSVLDNPRMCGICLWHFSDARTYSAGYSIGRPRTFNNKGTFDEYRRPKLAHAAVKDIFLGRD